MGKGSSKMTPKNSVVSVPLSLLNDSTLYEGSRLLYIHMRARGRPVRGGLVYCVRRDDLAALTQTSTQSVTTRLQQLEARGWVHVDRDSTPYEYHVLDERHAEHVHASPIDIALSTEQ